MLWTLRRMRQKHGSKVYAWVGMSNHQHIFNQSPAPETPESPNMVWPEKYTLVGDMFRDCFSLFARRFNKNIKRVGGVIRDRTRTVKVFDHHQSLTLLIYIFLNPVRAGIVKHPRDYPHSNFSLYAYGKIDPRMAGVFCLHPAFLALGRCAAVRRAKFRFLVEQAMRKWGLQKLIGISASHGPGRTKRQEFYDDFLRLAASWIPKKINLGRAPP